MAAAIAAAVLSGTATGGGTRAASFSARIMPPPKVQYAGQPVRLSIIVNNSGAAVRPFCVDFTDDNGSWDISMPGLSSWPSDTFCLALPGHARKTLKAILIPARSGSRKLSVTLGRAKLFRGEIRKAILTYDDDTLSWEQQFVIVG